MQRPDFGIGKFFLIKWTDERKAYIRHLAAQGLSASQIAVDIGLDAKSGPRINMACRKFGIKLTAKGGRRPQRPPPITVEIAENHVPTLGALASKYHLAKVDVARQLLAAMFDQGEAFCDNLLDLARDDS